jgi:hypothetical protein
VRVAVEDFRAKCLKCGNEFALMEKTGWKDIVPPALKIGIARLANALKN